MSERITDERLAELRTVATGATDGSWEADYDHYSRGIWPEGSGGEIILGEYTASDGFDSPCWESGTDEDLRHIETFDPPTVLALLDEVERLRGLADDPEAVERCARAAYEDALRRETPSGAASWEQILLERYPAVDLWRAAAREVLRAAIGESDD